MSNDTLIGGSGGSQKAFSFGDMPRYLYELVRFYYENPPEFAKKRKVVAEAGPAGGGPAGGDPPEFAKKRKVVAEGIPARWDLADPFDVKSLEEFINAHTKTDDTTIMVNIPEGSTAFKTIEKKILTNVKKIRVKSVELACNQRWIRTHRAWGGKKDAEAQWVFHGTSEENAVKIAKDDLNRSFCETAAFGHGIYFAVDPKYSLDGHCPKNNKGEKVLFLSRVHVGSTVFGLKNQIVPEAKDGEKPADSFTNGLNTVVTRNDAQHYLGFKLVLDEKR